jgi:hypothetical protein
VFLDRARAAAYHCAVLIDEDAMTKKGTAEKKEAARKAAVSGPAAGAARPIALGGRRFWLAGACLVVVLVAMTHRRVIRPINGLHSWGRGAWACFVRSHVRYGLGYTKGIMTMAFGNPPSTHPERYLDHPQLDVLLFAGPAAVLGIHDWTVEAIRMVLGVFTLLVFLGIVRRFIGDLPALIAGLLLAMFPLTAYFFPGSWRVLLAMLAFRFYLLATGQMPGQGRPRARHFVGLGGMLFLLGQLSWTGYFYAAAVGIHYVVRCIFRREWPNWAAVAIMVVVPLASAALALSVMAWGFDWDAGRIVELYKWRAAKGEALEFQWGAWLETVWRFAVANFTWPVLLLTGGYLVYYLVGRAVVFFRNRLDRKQRPVPLAYPALLLFLLPGVLQLLIFRGFVWKHQFAEEPLIPFLAIAAGLAIAGIGRVLASAGKPVAWIGQIALVLMVGWHCVQGAEYYYSIRWHPPEKIEMWKELNRLTPADKKLLSFDVQLDQLVVTQAKAKGPTYRGEPAWYIDREIVQAPGSQTLQATYRKINVPYAGFIQLMQQLRQAYQGGQVEAPRAQEIQRQAYLRMRSEIAAVLAAEVPALLREIEQQGATGQFPCYLIPAAYGQEAVNMLLEDLNRELAKRYRTIRFVPAKAHLDKDGKPPKRAEDVVEFGMRAYFIYDLTGKLPAATSPASP